MGKDRVKVCPCCGKIDCIGIQAKFRMNQLMYRVICNRNENHPDEFGCGLRTDWFYDMESAINAWNMRAEENVLERVTAEKTETGEVTERNEA